MTKRSGRKKTTHRKTNETDIKITLSLDGQGKGKINTGVPFMDHMLTLFSVHGFFDLDIQAQGDTEIDDHHTVEDLGICLGQTLKEALGDHSSINRYGDSAVPMDETLVRVTLDISNRPYLHYGVTLHENKVGTFDTELAKEFIRAFSLHAGLTIHVDMVRGENSHHIIEAIFKALGRALNEATTINPKIQGALSSKGSI